MGNCLHTTTTTRSSTHPAHRGDGFGVAGGRSSQEEGGGGGGMKVKIVLTRGELEWLMLQLKTGEKRLEDVLREMGRGTALPGSGGGDGDGWRPSLESIVEGPETGSAALD